MTIGERKDMFVTLAVMRAIHNASVNVRVIGFDPAFTKLSREIHLGMGKQIHPFDTIKVDLGTIFGDDPIPVWGKLLGPVNPRDKLLISDW